MRMTKPMIKIFTSALLASTVAGSAFAADLPSRRAPVVVAPAPIMTWTGFYAGLNAGYGWSNTNRANTYLGPENVPAFEALLAPGAVPSSLPVGNGGSVVGGGQIGWNYQFSPAFVAGIEADLQVIGGGSRNSAYTGAFATFLFTTVASTNQGGLFGTVRGRLGYLVTPSLLFYGTGGVAIGRNTVALGLSGPAPFSFVTPSAGGTQAGWTAGAGVEWMFAQNWSAKLEYLRYDLGTARTAPGVVTGGGNFASLGFGPVRASGNLVRAGVNYHFNFGGPGAVVAKY